MAKKKKARLGSRWVQTSPKPKPRPKPRSAPPKQSTIPGTPGVPRPPVDPFYTGDDLLAISQYETGEASQVADLDASIDKARIERDYQTTQLDDNFKQGQSRTMDDMAARGLFLSSVKDSTIYDLEATRSIQRNFLNDRFNQTLQEGARRKDLIFGKGAARERFWSAMQKKAIENASSLTAEQDPWITKPTPARTVTTSPQAPRGVGAKPQRTTTTPQATAGGRPQPGAPQGVQRRRGHQLANQLVAQGKIAGPRWQGVIKSLGYDPRKGGGKGKLRFR